MSHLIPAAATASSTAIATSARDYYHYLLSSIQSLLKQPGGKSWRVFLQAALQEEKTFETFGKFIFVLTLYYYLRHKSSSGGLFSSTPAAAAAREGSSSSTDKDGGLLLYENSIPFYVAEDDTRAALQTHLPLAVDRALIAARLQQQKQIKKLLLRLIGGEDIKEELKRITREGDAHVSKESIREKKLQCWSCLLRHSLTTLLASHYVYCLTVNLCLMKQVMKVITFVLHTREVKAAMEAEKAERERRRKANPSSAAAEDDEEDSEKKQRSLFSRWWSGGVKNLVMEMALEKMVKQQAQATASSHHYCPPTPFYDDGLGEEEEETHIKEKIKEVRRRREERQRHHQSRHSSNSNPLAAPGRVTVSTDSGAVHYYSVNDISIDESGEEEDELVEEELLLAAQCSLSITSILESAVPKIVRTVEEVVWGVLPLQPNPHSSVTPHPRASVFANMSEIITEEDVEILYALLRTEMNKKVDMGDWLTEAPHSGVGILERFCPPSRGSSMAGEARSPVNKEDEGDIIDYPPGSTVLLDARGKPIHPRRGNSMGSTNSGLVSEVFHDDDDDDFENEFLEHPARRPARRDPHHLQKLRQRHLLLQQQKEFFEELLASEDRFGELIRRQAEAWAPPRAALDLPSVRSYDSVTGTCRLLLYAAVLDGLRLPAVEEELRVPASSRLFAMEMTRATCQS